MIPAAMRSLWKQTAVEDNHHDDGHAGLGVTDHDMVLRYALIGIFVIMATASLSVARAVAMPVVGGLIFGFVFGPLVDRMVRFGLPQGLAAGLIVAAGVLIMLVMFGIFAAPFAIWSDRLPGIISALRNRLSDVAAMVERVELLAGGMKPGAVPQVTVAESSPWLNVALTSSAAASGILIFIATIYFYLATRRHLKARVLRLCLGGSARRSAGAFLVDIERKIASYFGMITLINLGMGLIAFVIAWWAGLPFPLFWGLVATVLNYIAFVGPLIMVALLFGAGLLEDGAGWRAALPSLAYFVIHLIEGNVVTPMLVGRRLTLSPFLVFISFVFWLWLWGPVGAILSTPLLLVLTLSIEAIADYRRMETQDFMTKGDFAKGESTPHNSPADMAVSSIS
jgi:predicted PurR-regulated permease PerM